MEIAPRISVDSKVCSGKPVIKGTRIPIEIILGQLAAGTGFEEIIKEYEISREDILAILNYATKVISNEVVKA